MAKRPPSARTSSRALATARPTTVAPAIEPAPIVAQVPIAPPEPVIVDAPAIALPTVVAATIELAPNVPEAVDATALPMAWLKMKTGLSGPDFCLSNGDEHPFDHTPGLEGEPSEAQRLVDAGFADFCDAPEG